MANNILYENKDVEVKLLMEEGVDDFLADAREKVQKRSAVRKPKKTKKQERLEQIQLQEFYDEFGTYPFSRSNISDPFYSSMEGDLLRC
jgi:hypothetical protein